MSKHPSNHARDACDRLKEDESDQPFPLAHYVWLVWIVSVSGDKIGAPSQESHGVVCNPI